MGYPRGDLRYIGPGENVFMFIPNLIGYVRVVRITTLWLSHQLQHQCQPDTGRRLLRCGHHCTGACDRRVLLYDDVSSAERALCLFSPCVPCCPLALTTKSASATQ